MQIAGFKPTVSILGSLIVICGQQGSVEQGFQIWNTLVSEGSQPNVDCLNALMNAAAEAYQGERALKLLRDAQTQGRNLLRLEAVSLHTY